MNELPALISVFIDLKSQLRYLFQSSAELNESQIVLTQRKTILLIEFNFNLASISDYITDRVWDEITYPFPNFNGACY